MTDKISAMFLLINGIVAIFLAGYMVGTEIGQPENLTTMLVVMLTNVTAVMTTYRYRRRRGF